MKRFYSSNITGSTAVLKGNERHHCIKVLRTIIGEEVEVVNGNGGVGRGKLISSDKNEALIELGTSLNVEPKSNHPIIAISIPKNPARWEYFLEKATEIGVSEIIPLLCKRSEKSKIKTERSNQILISAFKQSLHLYLPILHEPTAFHEVVSDKKYSNSEGYIAHCSFDKGHEDENPYLGVLHQKCAGNTNPIILIGPEGDFTPEEISLAKQNRFATVSLGPSRLRVETAGIAACNIIQCIDQLT